MNNLNERGELKNYGDVRKIGILQRNSSTKQENISAQKARL